MGAVCTLSCDGRTLICPFVGLSFREKQRFFQQLAQLLRSGAGLAGALEKLSRAGSGPLKQVAKKLNRSIERGRTAAEAFATLGALGPMEPACLAPAARPGRL